MCPLRRKALLLPPLHEGAPLLGCLKRPLFAHAKAAARSLALALIDGAAPFEEATRSPRERLALALSSHAGARWHAALAHSQAGLARLVTPASTARVGPSDRALQAWLLHFAFWSALRAGEHAQAATVKDAAEAARRSLGDASLDLEAVSERARLDMAQGRYPLAVQALVEFFEDRAKTRFALHSLFAAFSCLGTCLQAMGRYGHAEKVSAAQWRIVRLFPSRRLELQALRRQASLLVESERVAQADLFLARHAPAFDSSFSPIQSILFTQERLRLAIARSDYAAVRALFAELEDLVAKRGLSKSLLNLDEERCEVALREKGGLADLVPAFRKRLAENERSGDDAACAAIHLLLARVGLKRNNVPEALRHALASLALCERWSYGKTRVRCHLVLASAYQRQGAPLEALVQAEAARRLAAQMDLPLQRACADVLLARLQERRVELSALLRLLCVAGSFDELAVHMENYGVGQDFGVRASVLGAPEGAVVTLRDGFTLLQGLASGGAVFFLPDEALLLDVARTGTRGTERILPRDQAALLGFAWDAMPGGFRIADVHALRYPGVPFQVARHEPRAAMALSRLRQALRPLGIDIAFERAQGRYVLHAGGLAVRAMPLSRGDGAAGSTGARDTGRTPRQEALLAVLRRDLAASTGRLCEQLGITRQSLHPLIRPLLDSGIVVRRGEGKATRYLLVDNARS